MSSPANPMLTPRITKVTVNIGVGEGGNRLILAEKVLESLTKQKPVRTLSRKTNRDLGTRIGAPIGCKVTIRDSEKAHEFLKNALWVRRIPSMAGLSMTRGTSLRNCGLHRFPRDEI